MFEQVSSLRLRPPAFCLFLLRFISFFKQSALQKITPFQLLGRALVDIVLGQLCGGGICKLDLRTGFAFEVACDDDAVRKEAEDGLDLVTIFVGLVLQNVEGDLIFVDVVVGADQGDSENEGSGQE